MQRYRLFSVIGVIVAEILFLATALLPSVVYGGYAGVLLASGIFGSPLDQAVMPRLLVAFGMLLGVVSVASVYAVGGAVCGAVVGQAWEMTNGIAVGSKKEARR